MTEQTTTATFTMDAPISNPKPGTWYMPVTREDATHVQIRVTYDLGGLCYATYKQKPRGYYLSLTPVTREAGSTPGVTYERFTLFSGAAFVLEETKRQNPKRIAYWHERIAAQIPALVAAALDSDKELRNAAVYALIQS